MTALQKAPQYEVAPTRPREESHRRLRRLERPRIGTIFIWLWAAVSLVPLVWIAVQSVRPDVEFLTAPWSLPSLSTMTFQPYIDAIVEGSLGLYAGNSVLVVVAVVVAVLLLSLTAGYALSRVSFEGKRFFNGVVLVVLAFPGSILLLPMFLVVFDLDLLDTRLGLILPYITFSLPLSILLMKSAFDALPSELFAAARVDGCGEWRLFANIAVPLVPGSIATVCFLVFMPVWDEFLWASITLRDSDLFTLPIGLVYLDESKFVVGYNTVFAGMVLVALPILVVLLVAQRGFLSAVTAGAVKG